jgi:hypothetical protein
MRKKDFLHILSDEQAIFPAGNPASKCSESTPRDAMGAAEISGMQENQ